MATKLYPCPFNVGDRRSFANKHGTCTLEVVSAASPVSDKYSHNAPAECLIDFDTIEQIGLITDQVRLQPVGDWVGICTNKAKPEGAFVLHDTTKTCGWVKVVELKYTNPVPAKDQIDADMRGARGRENMQAACRAAGVPML